MRWVVACGWRAVGLTRVALGVAGVIGLVVVGLGGCLTSSSVSCRNDTVCAEGTVCRSVTDPAQDLCVTADQIQACVGKARYSHCETNGRCYDGVCLTVECGNGRVDRADPGKPGDVGENCDDGNQNSGDGCSGDCRSDETCGNGVLDPIKGELCDDGNFLQHDGCDSRCQLETPQWTLLTPSTPDPRTASAMAHDATRGRMVLFGGFAEIDFNDDAAVNDTWEWDGQVWLQVTPAKSPSPRTGHGMVYDAARRTVVLFGGEDESNTALADTWEWDGVTWTPIATPSAPSPRTEFGMVYDSARQRVIVFGGRTNVGQGPTVLHDTWEWDGTSWTAVSAPDDPSPQGAQFSMAYDPRRARTVLFGTGDQHDETWEYDGATRAWTQIQLAGPPGRDSSSLAFDVASQRIILFGGNLFGDDTPVADAWAYDGASWTMLPADPGPRVGHVMATDPIRRRVVLFGGAVDDSSTWEFDGTQWAGGDTTVPRPQAGTVVARDPLNGHTAVLGSLFGDTMMFEYDGLAFMSVDAPPAFSAGGAMAFDQAHGVAVLLDVSGATSLWDGASWTEPAVTDTPPAVSGCAMAYDDARQRTILFCLVHDDSGSAVPATWSWDGASWTQLSPAHTPGARVDAAFAWDPIRRELVLFGGALPDGSANLADTWAWTGIDWAERTPITSPLARVGGRLTWNASRQRLVLFGGAGDEGDASSVPLADVWEWDGAAWSAIPTANGPSGRFDVGMFSTSDGSGVLVYGGAKGVGRASGLSVDLWQLQWNSGRPQESCIDNIDLDGDGLAGCDDPDCWAVCKPLCPPGASCATTAPHCGDGVCNTALENCRICPEDCTCTPVCGDFYCDPGETHTSCPGDCPQDPR